jgi:hypothetical protein
MKHKPRRIDKRLLIAANMPPLMHKPVDGEFIPENSEVLNWIINQPGLVGYLMDELRYKGLITFNQETKLWQGQTYGNRPDN